MARADLGHWLVLCGHHCLWHRVLVSENEKELLGVELKILSLLQNSETCPQENGGEPSQADVVLCTDYKCTGSLLPCGASTGHSKRLCSQSRWGVTINE